MKTMKKIISLTMSVIMLITASPVLQAAEFADLNRAQMAELRQEILQDVRVDLNKAKDPVKELMEHYQQAKKNAETRLDKVNKVELTEEQKKVAEEYLNQLKEKAEELAKTEEYLVVPEQERKTAAFNDLLLRIDFDDIWDLDFGVDLVTIGGLINCVTGVIFFTYLLTGPWHGRFLNALATGSFYGWSGSGIIFVAGLIIMTFAYSYTPIISPSLSEEETCNIFSEKPFYYLAKFDEEKEKTYNEFAHIYGKCPQVLQDAVLIEEVFSANPNPQNMKDKLYIGSLGWYKMTTEERTAYLHDFAERLRAESKAKTNKYSKKVGLEEA